MTERELQAAEDREAVRCDVERMTRALAGPGLLRRAWLRLVALFCLSLVIGCDVGLAGRCVDLCRQDGGHVASFDPDTAACACAHDETPSAAELRRIRELLEKANRCAETGGGG